MGRADKTGWPMNHRGAHSRVYARPFGETAMNRFAVILAVVILPGWVLPAHADGIFGLFSKKTKANPAERVPQLIVTLKTEQDERKRAAAASELGSYDADAFGEIVPVLVDALQHDPKAGVPHGCRVAAWAVFAPYPAWPVKLSKKPSPATTIGASAGTPKAS